MELFTIEHTEKPGEYVTQARYMPNPVLIRDPDVNEILFFNSRQAAQRVVDAQKPEIAVKMRIVKFAPENS